MALLSATYLQDIRIKYAGDLDRQEWRTIRYGLLTAAMEQTMGLNSLVSEDLRAQLPTSEGRTIAHSVIKKSAGTVLTARSCTITATGLESDLVNVVFATAAMNVVMTKAQYFKNEIAYEQDFAKQLQKVIEGFNSTVETQIYTQLDAAKSVIYNSGLVGVAAKYPLVGDAQQVANADQDLYFNDVESIQAADDFYGRNMVIGSTSLSPFVRHWINQGGGNSTNLSYQFGNFDFKFTNAIVDGAGDVATGFNMPAGTIGLVTRVGIDGEVGSTTSDGTSWSKVTLPGMQFPVQMQYKSTCADQSALNGAGLAHLSATEVEYWQFSFDYATLVAYNSDIATLPSGLKKFEFTLI